jgi:hypothetical protein
MMAVSPETLIRFVRALIQKETTQDFPRLRRVPSTYTWRCLDHLQTIGRSRREQLFDHIAERAPVHLGLQPPPAKWQSPETARFYDEVLQKPSPHIPARLLRGMVASMRTDGPQGYFSSLPESVIRRADTIHPTTASKIRGDVKSEFGQHFGATGQNLGGGNWLYTGESRGRPFSVLVDYGGRGDQLRYFVQFSDAVTGLKTKTLSYEGLLGMGFGQWDFVTADSQLEDIKLLCELIGELVAIPDQLAAFG